jgi:hypothetical protein
LFTDIATAFPDTEHIMFNYNSIDETNNTLTATPLDIQAQMLADVFERTRLDNPDAIIDLICHCEGGIPAALAKLSMRRTILLASADRVFDIDSEIFTRWKAVTGDDGTMHWSRRDGTITIIGQDYWQSVRQLGGGVVGFYRGLAEVTELSIIAAGQDEVLGSVDYSRFGEDVEVSLVDRADHNFRGESRRDMIEVVKKILCSTN